MPVFRPFAGPARRLAALLLLSIPAAGCAAAAPDLPELRPADMPATAPAASAFAGYHTFAPGLRDDWHSLKPAPVMDHSGMDHSKMDHSRMGHGMQPAETEAAPRPAMPAGHKH
ncbi:hypothetical protein [Ferrovibrio sp.]|uniref:hypothetical protein n=2 Tax=Ferrovibrio sp. TaxID=1917215 RepID=UPI00351551B9